MSEKVVELFGGAITCVLPASAEDVSNVREVPDNQEVYNEAETGTSFIVELLSRHREVSDAECGAFFFGDLARANGCAAGEWAVASEQSLDPSDCPNVSTLPRGAGAGSGQCCAHGVLTSGMQMVSKYTNERGRENEVLVVLAVLRFPPLVSTDVLVSISAPRRIHPESSEARVVRQLRGEAEVMEAMRRILHTLTVRDWGLFVPEP